MSIAQAQRKVFSGHAVLLGTDMMLDASGAIYLPATGALVVSDLHLEKGSSYARRGRLLPPYDTAATLQRLGTVIERHSPQIVISLGDSFHDGEGAARIAAPYRAVLEQMMSGRDWVWVAGNHDPDVPADLPGDCVTELAVDGLVFRHEPSGEAARGEIAGHLHPCARIVQRGRSVRRRCFATDGTRLIMPAFGSFTGSLNVMDKAYRGLFSWESFIAYMMGDTQIYPIAGAILRPD